MCYFSFATDFEVALTVFFVKDEVIVLAEPKMASLLGCLSVA